MGKRPVISLIVFSIISLFIVGGGYLALRIYKTYLYLQSVPFIEDAEQFAKEFDPSIHNYVDYVRFETRCHWWRDFLCKTHVDILSPLFPYLALGTSHNIGYSTQFEGKKQLGYRTDNKSIRIDRFWKAFWINYSGGGAYGPYRSDFKEAEIISLSLRIEEEKNVAPDKSYQIHQQFIKGKVGVGDGFLRLNPHGYSYPIESKLTIRAFSKGRKIFLYEEEREPKIGQYFNNTISEVIDTSSLPPGRYEFFAEKRDVYRFGLVIATIFVREEVTIF